jgi:hypothetical protein
MRRIVIRVLPLTLVLALSSALVTLAFNSPARSGEWVAPVGRAVQQWPTSTPGPSPTPEPVREYAGIYGAGFEVSSFVTGTLLCPGYAVGWWLWPDKAFVDRFEALYPPEADPPNDYQRVYTRFRGALTPPGHYGHLGSYARQVTVVELLEMVRIDHCPLPDGPPMPPPPLLLPALRRR